jgi:acetoin utilization protein AcuB
MDMLVKNIMIPLENLTKVEVDTTVADAIRLIDQNNLLSLPVVEGEDFVGIISKKYIFEEYFNQGGEKEIFLQKKVREFMKTKIDSVNKKDIVEVPAQVLTKTNLQFIPVVDEKGKFCGIVTHKAIFKAFTQVLGFGHTRIALTTRDVKGRLAKLAEIITKQGANIISIVEIDLEVMNLRELVLRVDAPDTKKLIDSITKAGFSILRVDESKEEVKN